MGVRLSESDGPRLKGKSFTAEELRALETLFKNLSDSLSVVAVVLGAAAAVPEPGTPVELLGAMGAGLGAILTNRTAEIIGDMARSSESSGATASSPAPAPAPAPAEGGQGGATGGVAVLAGKLNAAVGRVDDASLTFEALVQVFGEAVARIDDASRRLADVMDGLLGPGGDMPEEPEPGFERTSFRPSGVSGGAMALAPAGASAALMPVDESFADASRAVAGFVDDSEGVLGELGEFSERMFGELGDALGGVLETGELEWRDFARVAIDAIADILAEQAKLLFGDGDASGGGAGGLLGGLLSGVIGGIAGAFAHGGRPNVGMTALVGEAGPELFIPDVPGTIIPHGAFGGFAGAGADAAPTVITNFTIDARGAERGVERRIAEAMAQAEQRISQNVMAHILNNARRGGAFARMSRR